MIFVICIFQDFKLLKYLWLMSNYVGSQFISNWNWKYYEFSTKKIIFQITCFLWIFLTLELKIKTFIKNKTVVIYFQYFLIAVRNMVLNFLDFYLKQSVFSQ